MSITSLEVYPTCEIHLLKKRGEGHPYNRPMLLEVRGRDQQKNLKNISAGQICWEIDPNNTDLVDIQLQETPTQKFPVLQISSKENSSGVTTARLRHKETNEAVLVRIRVHDDVDDFWIGNNQVTIYIKKSNYVLSVYAEFTDGTFGDITSHPYLNFTVPPGHDPFIEVDDKDDKGRITGKLETADSPKRIDVNLNNTIKSVVVRVTKPLNTPKPILECIWGSADVKRRNNILISSEGFTKSQEAAFRLVSQLIAYRLMEGRNDSPYNLLSEKFNIWIAFDPSPEDGITVGYPVDFTQGIPITAGSDNEPIGPATAREFRLTQARDSKFGLMYGLRYGDQRSFKLEDPNTCQKTFAPGDENRWLLQPRLIPVTDMYFDRRRTENDWLYLKFLDEYIDSLKVNQSKHQGSQFNNG